MISSLTAPQLRYHPVIRTLHQAPGFGTGQDAVTAGADTLRLGAGSAIADPTKLLLRPVRAPAMAAALVNVTPPLSIAFRRVWGSILPNREAPVQGS